MLSKQNKTNNESKQLKFISYIQLLNFEGKYAPQQNDVIE